MSCLLGSSSLAASDGGSALTSSLYSLSRPRDAISGSISSIGGALLATPSVEPALQSFFDKGWSEAGFLGSGARGPVLRVKETPRSGDSEGSVAALKRSTAQEVRALEELACCRNVVALHEQFLGDIPGQVWARLELLEGGTLRSYMRAQKDGVCEDNVRFILSQLLQGLEEIHRKGWMHRDVKAENIGFTAPRDGECLVKLMDFDTAVRVAVHGDLSEVVGTVENMSPEVFAGAYDERADCWSLGVVAYELLFGYRPFNDACIDQVEEMVRNWKKYLLLPSDASEATSCFVRALLTDKGQRLSSREAARHRWLCGSAAGRQGFAASVSRALRERSRAHTVSFSGLELASKGAEKEGQAEGQAEGLAGGRGDQEGSTASTTASETPPGDEQSMWRRPARKWQTQPSYIFEGKLPQSPPRRPFGAESPAGGAGGDLESLSRLRRSLSEWNSLHFDAEKVEDTGPYGRQRPAEARRQVADDAVDSSGGRGLLAAVTSSLPSKFLSWKMGSALSESSSPPASPPSYGSDQAIGSPLLPSCRQGGSRPGSAASATAYRRVADDDNGASSPVSSHQPFTDHLEEVRRKVQLQLQAANTALRDAEEEKKSEKDVLKVPAAASAASRSADDLPAACSSLVTLGQKTFQASSLLPRVKLEAPRPPSPLSRRPKAPLPAADLQLGEATPSSSSGSRPTTYSSPAAVGPAFEAQHDDYLERVRARTQEMISAAEKLTLQYEEQKKRNALEPGSPTHARSPSSPLSPARCRLHSHASQGPLEAAAGLRGHAPPSPPPAEELKEIADAPSAWYEDRTWTQGSEARGRMSPTLTSAFASVPAALPSRGITQVPATAEKRPAVASSGSSDIAAAADMAAAAVWRCAVQEESRRAEARRRIAEEAQSRRRKRPAASGVSGLGDSASAGLANSRSSSSERPKEAEAKDDDETCESPLKHLLGVKARAQELLRKLSTPDLEVPANAAREDSESGSHALLLANGKDDGSEAPASPSRRAPLPPMASSSPGAERLSGPRSSLIVSSGSPLGVPPGMPSSSSPRSWLAAQRSRTQVLLTNLRRASERIDGSGIEQAVARLPQVTSAKEAKSESSCSSDSDGC
eukprot:TRINITY_DN27212_c0_g1_i1.p1 TRINITY_DN27212_c0_g1~~TRINITY_DN27212_c0_g1_i1.p1  ORF type:complete len:1102 (-),score=257.20 TRINITY_DN27212_c0_g1_i1:199-3504(-)